jgi:lipopolysaccharide export LptBFGC system permease protein LptF
VVIALVALGGGIARSENARTVVGCSVVVVDILVIVLIVTEVSGIHDFASYAPWLVLWVLGFLAVQIPIFLRATD